MNDNLLQQQWETVTTRIWGHKEKKKERERDMVLALQKLISKWGGKQHSQSLGRGESCYLPQHQGQFFSTTGGLRSCSSWGHCLACLWFWGKNFPFFCDKEMAVSALHIKGGEMTHTIQHIAIEQFTKHQEQETQRWVKLTLTLRDFKLFEKADTWIHKFNSMVSAISELRTWSLGNTDRKELIMLRKLDREGLI